MKYSFKTYLIGKNSALVGIRYNKQENRNGVKKSGRWLSSTASSQTNESIVMGPQMIHEVESFACQLCFLHHLMCVIPCVKLKILSIFPNKYRRHDIKTHWKGRTEVHWGLFCQKVSTVPVPSHRCKHKTKCA